VAVSFIGEGNRNTQKNELTFVNIYKLLKNYCSKVKVMQGQSLTFSLQLPTGLHKITIVVAQQKFLGSRN
jgi:hypothetical protein